VRGADLRGADLRDADVRCGCEIQTLVDLRYMELMFGSSLRGGQCDLKELRIHDTSPFITGGEQNAREAA